MYSLRITSSMLERVRRSSEAAKYQPSASAGMMRLRQSPLPLVGSQSSQTENTRISTSPSQKPGIDSPSSATTLPALSQPLLTLTADMQPRRDADEERDQRGRQRQLQRIGQALEIERADRHLVVEGLAEFAGEDVLHEGGVLHRPGAVEPPFGADAVEILGARAGLGQQGHRVAGQPDHHEDRQAEDEQRDEP